MRAQLHPMHMDLSQYKLGLKHAVNRQLYRIDAASVLNKHHKIVESAMFKKPLITVSVGIKAGSSFENLSQNQQGASLLLSKMAFQLPLNAAPASALSQAGLVDPAFSDPEHGRQLLYDPAFNINDRAFLKKYINGSHSSSHHPSEQLQSEQHYTDYESVFQARLGTQATCSFGREHLIYSVMTVRDNARAALYYLLEHVFNINWSHLCRDHNPTRAHTRKGAGVVPIEHWRGLAHAQFRDLVSQDPLEFLIDQTSRLAYEGSPLGTPTFMGVRRDDGLSSSAFHLSGLQYASLRDYYFANYNVGNTLIAASNTEPHTLAQYLHEYYIDKI